MRQASSHSTSYNFPSSSVIPSRGPIHRPRRPPPPFKPTPAVTSDIASKALRRAIVAELSTAGFSAADEGALERLEREVIGRVEELYARTHEYANLASRAAPIATDLLRACVEVEPALLQKKVRKRKRRKGIVVYSSGFQPVC